MPNVLVRDLPDDVHRTLRHRATSSGQSLQQFLVSELTRLANRPSMSEVLARIDRLEGGRIGLTRAVADLHADRPAS